MTTTTPGTHDGVALTRERADLLETLARHRYFLRQTTQGLTDEQARLRPTVSELSLGGLIKHVATTETHWVDFLLEVESADMAEAGWLDRFRLTADDTLDGVLAEYAAVAGRTEAAIAEVPDLDHAIPLPEAPWFEPGATWTVRRVLLHLIAETSQHAGHADILRESIDGAKTMG